MDFLSFISVIQAVKQFKVKKFTLDILINDAAVRCFFNLKYSLIKDPLFSYWRLIWHWNWILCLDQKLLQNTMTDQSSLILSSDQTSSLSSQILSASSTLNFKDRQKQSETRSQWSHFELERQTSQLWWSCFLSALRPWAEASAWTQLNKYDHVTQRVKNSICCA